MLLPAQADLSSGNGGTRKSQEGSFKDSSKNVRVVRLAMQASETTSRLMSIIAAKPGEGPAAQQPAEPGQDQQPEQQQPEKKQEQQQPAQQSHQRAARQSVDCLREVSPPSCEDKAPLFTA
jgi:hypothetical protein